jgi:8-oxo-dGTP pyrophosphatase MutT (NUDIX family)
MKKERPKLIPTAYLVLVRENKILLSRRYNTGFMDGMYGFPAGHLKDDEETLSQAMVREAREEIGAETASEDLELVHVMHRKQRDYLAKSLKLLEFVISFNLALLASEKS